MKWPKSGGGPSRFSTHHHAGQPRGDRGDPGAQPLAARVPTRPDALRYFVYAPQADLMADDVSIDFEQMKLWDRQQVTYYFENGGEEPPAEWTPPPCVPLGLVRPFPALGPLMHIQLRSFATCSPLLPQVDEATFKKWFPKWKAPAATPKFRLVCFHNAGSAESNYTGKGVRMPNDNPFVVACNERGGELLALELPGRESRRAESRFLKLAEAAEALFPILAPKLNDGARRRRRRRTRSSQSPGRQPISWAAANLVGSNTLRRRRRAPRWSESIVPVGWPSRAPTRPPPLPRGAGVPYMLVGHSMGTWMLFEFLKLLMARGVQLPAQVTVSSFREYHTIP